MIAQLAALLIFVAVFAIGSLRGAHIGILMFTAACGVWVWLAEMPLAEGVTYFFGIARANGTVDRAIEAALGRVGDRAVLLPFFFFGLTAVVAAMGAPLAGLVIARLGMPVARKYGLDPC